MPLTRKAFAAVDLDRLVAAQQALSQQMGATPDPSKWGEIVLNAMAFEPVIDGDVLPVLPIRAVQAGAGSEVDLLIGANTDEHSLFLMPNGFVDIVDETVLGMVLAGYGLTPDALAPPPGAGLRHAHRGDARPARRAATGVGGRAGRAGAELPGRERPDPAFTLLAAQRAGRRRRTCLLRPAERRAREVRNPTCRLTSGGHSRCRFPLVPCV